VLPSIGDAVRAANETSCPFDLGQSGTEEKGG